LAKTSESLVRTGALYLGDTQSNGCLQHYIAQQGDFVSRIGEALGLSD
jgi:hypothetical protein